MLWGAAGAGAALAAASALAEHRRTKRRDVDRVGWVPWNALQIAGLFAAFVAAALALKAG